MCIALVKHQALGLLPLEYSDDNVRVCASPFEGDELTPGQVNLNIVKF